MDCKNRPGTGLTLDTCNKCVEKNRDKCKDVKPKCPGIPAENVFTCDRICADKTKPPNSTATCTENTCLLCGRCISKKTLARAKRSYVDCNGSCYSRGSPRILCGKCVGGGTGVSRESVLNACGRCKGEKLDCEDCEGKANGKKVEDSCGKCVLPAQADKGKVQTDSVRHISNLFTQESVRNDTMKES